MGMKIGELAQITRLAPPTIRYYEEIGLLPRPSRVGRQRRYAADDVRRLMFIRRCRDLGFPIEQVRLLALLMQDSKRSCMGARDLAEAHLTAVREKLLEPRALEHSIAEFIETADATCPGGSGADCAVAQRPGRIRLTGRNGLRLV
jgi:MerR family transcriptional regulator, copper efflux regulator